MTPADEMPTINKRGIDTIMSLKKKIAAAFIACAMTLAVVPSSFACTALYVGSDLTEDGTTMFGRIEDLGTNEKGVMVSATESLYGTDAVLSVDPYVDNGRRNALWTGWPPRRRSCRCI